MKLSCFVRLHPDRLDRLQPRLPGRRRAGLGRAPAHRLPGGQLGFLIVVNILVFFLAFFLDFFELSFIVIPLIGPVAIKLGIDPVWFGVLLAVNMQTSFMHPPFGFALFYLRSVAPTDDYQDRVTNKKIARVTTGQIYWGAVPFVLIQVVMVGLIITFPGIVSRDTGGEKVHMNELQREVDQLQQQADPLAPPPPDAGASGTSAAGDEDPMAAILRANKEDKANAEKK